MPLFAIRQYQAEIEKLLHYGGSNNETSIRNAFSRLLDYYAQARDLKLVPEISIKTKTGKVIRPDGTLKDSLRIDHGYWESKDSKDDIDEEIRKKHNKGYPFENIIFEDSSTAILFQNDREVLRIPMSDGEELDKLLNLFVRFEREEVKKFHKAIAYFKEDIPKVTLAIHQVITDQKNNLEFEEALKGFYLLCQQAINSSITIDDIREMLVQHILTADIFNTIFDEPHFHQENNIARELNKVIESFFVGSTRRSALNSIKHYYDTINATAAAIADHHEKQKFLKVVYENFYKAYNPKAADRLGTVYTPNEVVKFMIESTDFLLNRHFGKVLADRNVEILDPATGTGTFMCDIIDHLRASGTKKLEYKYKNELHANEVAILPYYIANLNIEYTYKQATGNYEEFTNLCFVDTLDNTGFAWQGKQIDLFGLSAENVARIRNQNRKKISVIIGNPPYNAGQQNENENNQNRKYPVVDKRIRDTFIRYSTAQKTKMYDMYSRFYRWAMDRVDENGIIAFITNRSFIESRTFDGFRKCIQADFDYAYIIDTKSDVRNNPKIAGTTHNVFGIQAGVAILFLIRSANTEKKGQLCEINYVAMQDDWKKEIKLKWLAEHSFDKIEFEKIVPDKDSNWIGIVNNDWNDLVTLINKNVKQGKSQEAIFKLFSLGVVTARDEWVYDLDKNSLSKKVEFLISRYNQETERLKGEKKHTVSNNIDYSIKWTRSVKKDLVKGIRYTFNKELLFDCSYRPFIKKKLYYSVQLNEMRYQMPRIFPETGEKNLVIAINQGSKPFNVLASKYLTDYHFNGDSNCIPQYCYSQDGTKVNNISNWGREKFEKYYKRKIKPEEILYYIYAVLHNPAYRKKYEVNLKREFPRIPFYKDFYKWVQWGKELVELHSDYESAKPYKLLQKEISTKSRPKAKLKLLRERGIIQIDENLELHNVPPLAWEYVLGNRSAIEWVLDQYKEKKVNDKTIEKKFNTYGLQSHKEKLSELLKKVCTISVRTMEIVNAMPLE